MAIDRRFIGTTSEPRIVDVERGALRFFAKATGETNPIYFDDEAARAAGHPSLPAPPTYLFSLHLGAPAQRGNLLDPESGMGIDLRNILHGEQQFTYHRAIHAGDRLTLTTTLVDLYEKKGGALEFAVENTTAVNDEGELMAEMRVVTVIRHA